VTGMEKLLTRIKAIFDPRPPAEPPSEVDETPMPAFVVPEAVETRTPAPIAVLEDGTAADEMPAIALEAPTVTEEPPAEDEPEAVVATPGGLMLRLEGDRGSRSTFEVTKSGATIGRGPESTIQLADLSVSRKHARITYKQGAYWLSDLGSMGGTWIDGTKLAAPRRVATGQIIDIGVCRLTVVAAAEREKSGAAKGPSNAA